MKFKKKWIILFRVFLTVLFLISIVDFMTIAGMFIYNNFIVGKTLMVTFLGILISTAEILYIHLFIEYFKEVTNKKTDCGATQSVSKITEEINSYKNKNLH